MDLKVSHTFLQVHDQDEALVFYRDVLGLELRTDTMFGTFRWLSVGPPNQPNVEVVLEIVGMARAPQDAETMKELLAKGSLPGLIFTTPDLDGTFEKVRASGAEVMQEPIDQPYGVRDCAFRDPSGNHIRFSSR
ncbi:VOC family protein [Umezawaea tangerina]|uniref:Putative glyoxalase superfamily protein PhnB n=1 Tax=Umezawaea tangerina TaxID=84725 RepID=A0A2T0TLI1_9PSEU|nr:VOC family protein [Umezawaea tangerina]PRY46526.1 putative glyoxalase superfamily protein PhnB [Umezawaea tangerina]